VNPSMATESPSWMAVATASASDTICAMPYCPLTLDGSLIVIFITTIWPQSAQAFGIRTL
jgi:hypothetical protein